MLTKFLKSNAVLNQQRVVLFLRAKCAISPDFPGDSAWCVFLDFRNCYATALTTSLGHELKFRLTQSESRELFRNDFIIIPIELAIVAGVLASAHLFDIVFGQIDDVNFG